MATSVGWDQQALARLANETGCASIDVESPGKIVALFASCVVACVIAVCVLTGLHWWWFNRRPKLKLREERQNKALQKVQIADLKGSPGKAPRFAAKLHADSKEPDLAKAKEHFLETSPVDKDKKWRSIWGTSIREIGLLGGPGLGLYFTILVYLGLCFSYMWIFSIPLSAFTLLGDFAPDGSGIFPQLSIANLGTESTDGVAQENRLVVMGCQGMPVSDLTKYFGWLDFIGMLLFTVCAFWLCFKKVPETDVELDEENIQASDYTLEVDFMPETLASGHSDYAQHLENHLLGLITEGRSNPSLKKFYKAGTPEAKVIDTVLVRDRCRKLGSQKQIAELELNKEIQEFKGKTEKAQQVQEKIEKVKASLKDIGADEGLPVLRAFVTLNATGDVVALLHRYRFSRYALLRACQTEKLRFMGSPIRVRRAPEPSNICWDNQDVPWKSRQCRKALVWLVCAIIVLVCLGLMFLTTKQANELVKKYETSSSPGHVSCNSDGTATPAPPSCTPIGWDVQNINDQWVLFDANGARVGNQTQETMDCFCAQKGAANIIQDQNLVGACEDLLLAYGLRLGITLLAALIVVVVNVGMAAFLMSFAQLSLPLTVSELNNMQMMTVFISQALNTTCVVFAVHYENIDDFQRGWYVVVGVAVCMTMSCNTVVNAACYFLIWGIAVMKRMCTGVKNKHQAELLQVWQNPPWDMASRYAYLLMTVYVTMVYSSGMPVLNLLAVLYCFFSYWSDKAVLLWGSMRPPQYDAVMPRRTAWWLIYAGALHCVAAIAMYGHPCVFPSNPLGGSLGSLSQQGSSAVATSAQNAADETQGKMQGMASTFIERWGRDCTWMFAVMLFFLLCFCGIYIVLKVLGSTCGEFISVIKELVCPKREKVAPDDQMSTPWAVAAVVIAQERPPASYRMEDHPDFMFLAKYMQAARSGFLTD